MFTQGHIGRYDGEDLRKPFWGAMLPPAEVLSTYLGLKYLGLLRSPVAALSRRLRSIGTYECPCTREPQGPAFKPPLDAPEPSASTSSTKQQIIEKCLSFRVELIKENRGKMRNERVAILGRLGQF